MQKYGKDLRNRSPRCYLPAVCQWQNILHNVHKTSDCGPSNGSETSQMPLKRKSLAKINQFFSEKKKHLSCIFNNADVHLRKRFVLSVKYKCTNCDILLFEPQRFRFEKWRVVVLQCIPPNTAVKNTKKQQEACFDCDPKASANGSECLCKDQTFFPPHVRPLKLLVLLKRQSIPLSKVLPQRQIHLCGASPSCHYDLTFHSIWLSLLSQGSEPAGTCAQHSAVPSACGERKIEPWYKNKHINKKLEN